MTDPPFATIIVPNYNEAHRLPRCLDSLLALDWPADQREIVVVDNGSTDASRDVAGRYASRGVRLLVEKKIRSSYACRNLGAHAARGDLLAFTDSDAWVDPLWLRNAWEAMAARGADYAGTSVILHPAGPPTPADLQEMIFDFEMQKALERSHYSPTVSMICTRELFRRIKGFDESLFSGGDADFGRRAHAAGARQIFVPGALVNHPTRGSARALLRKALRYSYGTMKLVRYHTAHHFSWRYLFFLVRNILPPNPVYLSRRARERGVPLKTADHFGVYLLFYFIQLASTWGAIIALVDGKRQTAFRSDAERARLFTN